MIINLVAEGLMEEVVASRLLPYSGHVLGTVYGRKGYTYIRQKAAKFCHYATDLSGVLVLTDFRDSGAICVPDALKEYLYDTLPNPPKTFLYRFAVNELESWLIADRDGLAKYLRIPVSQVPLHPERETNPKRKLADLARLSKKKAIRDGIAPQPSHRSIVGPEYVSLMNEYIIHHWNIDAALNVAPSLERCVRRLCELNK